MMKRFLPTMCSALQRDRSRCAANYLKGQAFERDDGWHEFRLSEPFGRHWRSRRAATWTPWLPLRASTGPSTAAFTTCRAAIGWRWSPDHQTRQKRPVSIACLNSSYVRGSEVLARMNVSARSYIDL